jgi:hypothetical protein
MLPAGAKRNGTGTSPLNRMGARCSLSTHLLPRATTESSHRHVVIGTRAQLLGGAGLKQPVWDLRVRNGFLADALKVSR